MPQSIHPIFCPFTNLLPRTGRVLLILKGQNATLTLAGIEHKDKYIQDLLDNEGGGP